MIRKISAYFSFYHVSLKKRLLLYFLVLVILPTSIISITIYANSNQTIQENISSSVQKNLFMAESMLLDKFEEMNSLMDTIYMNPDMIAALSSERPVDQVGIVNELADLNKIIGDYALPNNYGNQYFFKLYMLDRPEYILHNFSQYVSTINVIEREHWYTKLPPQFKYSIVGLRENLSDPEITYTIMMAKRLFGLNNNAIPYAGLLTLEANLEDFNRVLSQLQPSERSSILIIDEFGDVVISPDASILQQNMTDLPYIQKILGEENEFLSRSFLTDIEKEQSLVTYRYIQPLGWNIVSLSPMSDLNSKLIAFRNVMFAALTICFVLALIIAIILSNSITKPILQVIRSMSYAKSGNFNMEVEYKRRDEFSFLVDQYNKMIRQLKELIEKLYLSEVKKKEAELKALQAQINPHFLYNTLDSINWIALRHKVPDISLMVTSLSDFFRYSLNKGDNIIKIENEIKQVESYLSIQQIRFKERLQYTIQADEEIHQYYTVKLILQPLVENSLVHGIEKRLGTGLIVVEAYKKDNWITIEVRDNGVGADIDKLNATISRETSGSQSFGLNNVNQRIKQAFGSKAGIHFKNNEDNGLTVVVRFPCKQKLEDFDNETKNGDS